ncbi:MAG: DNA polymerase III subunit [Bacillota bacterium]|nr:DNA polymerase III subunit [Bacillota bacterium]
MRFEKIIGNENILKNLEDMVLSNRINHALLFQGPSGIGKKYTAKIFAKSLLCTGADGPCDTCPACRQFESDSNPDFLFVQPVGNSLKKEQIQDLIDFLSIRPFNSPYKIGLVEGFDKATVEAQNAFLKTLEEGPAYGIIILLAENKKNILETVLSRVKTYSFTAIETIKIVEYLLDNYKISNKEANFYAKYSNGSIGSAIKMAQDPEFNRKRLENLEIFHRALKGQKDYVLKELKNFKDQEDIDSVLDMYLTWLRDLVIYKQTQDRFFLYNIDQENKLVAQSYLDYELINFVKERLIDLKSTLKYNVNKDLALELFFIDILEECQ